MPNKETVMNLQNDVLPQLPSTEFSALHALISRTLRIARHHDPMFKQDELMSQPAVQVLIEFITQQVQCVFDIPPLYFGQRLQYEYIHKKYWSLDEAVSLVVGMDPFYFTLNPDYYNHQWKNRRTQVKACVIRAIRQCVLPVTNEGSHYNIEPSIFCCWALATVKVDETTTAFFTKIKNELHPSTSGAFGEQLEFDFGPEFSCSANEQSSEINSTSEQPSSPCERGGFIGIKEDRK